MARTFAVIGAATVVLLGLHASGAASESTACTDSVVSVEITAPGGQLALKCPTGQTVKPDSSADQVKNVFLDDKGAQSEELSKLCPGATGTINDVNVTLTVPQLPNTTKTFYLLCHYSSDYKCGFAVTVKPPLPEGPQACVVAGTTVTLGITGEGSSTRFSCGEQLSVLSPTGLTKAYGSDCRKEEDLKDMTLKSAEENSYVLTATKKPKNKELCFLCTKKGAARDLGAGGENCAVMISVSAGSGLASRSAFGLALPFVVTLLHFS